MGVVYRAIDEKLHREVAIKVLNPQLLQHENLKERFRREARMHARIMHPHIVTLLSLYEDNQHMALVMEMIHGKNLKEYLAEHPRLDLPEIVRISEAILSGLDAAHRQGMVHRDLKPANVMLANNGGIKLMDFGLAKPKQDEDDLTQSGATVGSFRYMAPEQILNQAVDARTDLYAFGILLYQMVTGRLPFDASASGGEFEIMEKQVRHDPTPPQQIHAGVPTALSELIMRLLAKNRESRPEDCASVQRRLLEILKQAERARSHATQVIHAPKIQPQQTSGEIAKGLIRAWSRQLWRMLVDTGQLLRLWLWHKPAAGYRAVMASQAMQTLPARVSAQLRAGLQRLPAVKGHGPWVWSGVTIGILALGWMLLGILHLSERPAQPPAATTVAETAKAPPTPPAPAAKAPTPVATVTSAVAPAAPAKAEPVTPKPEVQPKPKPKPKPRVVRRARPKPAPRPSSSSITYRVDYKVVNSQFDHIDPNKPNEFRGGSRLYFASLKDNRTDKYRAYQKGWVRLYFSHPVHLSAIHIQRISVTQRDFRGGRIQLAVQNARGHWTVLFRRNNEDISKPVTIRGRASVMDQVKGIRLRFRSPEPLTVGPIDLLP